MAKKYQNESLYSLQMYTQFIEGQSTDLISFIEQCKNALQQNKIGVTYYDKTKRQVQSQIEINNKALDEIESELSSRMRKKFPQLMTFKKTEILGKSFQTEIDSFAELINTKELDTKKESKVVDFSKTTKEKKHVKKDD
tara:strand:+ start:502 stop:918 length:417 start_codon:yes stop_codon:yes gene_type:complete